MYHLMIKRLLFFYLICVSYAGHCVLQRSRGNFFTAPPAPRALTASLWPPLFHWTQHTLDRLLYKDMRRRRFPASLSGRAEQTPPRAPVDLVTIIFSLPHSKEKKKKRKRNPEWKHSSLRRMKTLPCIMCKTKGIVPHTFNSLQISTLCQHLKFGERFEFYTNIYIYSFLLTLAKVIQCINKYINKNCEHLNI